MLVPLKVGLSAKGFEYSGGKGGVNNAREGGEYDGASRSWGMFVDFNTIFGCDINDVVSKDMIGEGDVEWIILCETWASYAGTLRFVVAELCATLLNTSAIFFSSAEWSILNSGLLDSDSDALKAQNSPNNKHNCSIITCIIGIIDMQWINLCPDNT